MKILIDTNVILDVLLQRADFFDASYAILKLSALDKIEVFLPASAITDIYNIMRKANKDTERTKVAIIQLLGLINIADTMTPDVTNALLSEITDLEDALATTIARRIKADYIVTRNIKNFKNSPVPAIEPKAFNVLAV